MGVALQVLLLAVAIVVAVAGIGAALALRLSARQRRRQRRAAIARSVAAARTRARRTPTLPPSAGSAAVAPAVATVAAAAKPPPADAHQARLQALQALLALGDAKAEQEAQSGYGVFADTCAFEDDAPGATTAEPVRPAAAPARGDAWRAAPLLNLDALPPPRR